MASARQREGTHSVKSSVTLTVVTQAAAGIRIGMVLSAGPAVAVASVALFHETSPVQIIEEINRRAMPPVAPDRFSAPFEQTRPEACGAAALAFLLSYVGSYTQEAAVLSTLNAGGDEPLSFADLRRAAGAYGFAAEGHAVSHPAELADHMSLPIIVHLRGSHFVVLLSISMEDAAFFDPALGRVIHADPAAFMRSSTGRILKLRTQEHGAPR